MFKASTIYAAYGKHPSGAAAAPQQDLGAGGFDPAVHNKDSSSLIGSLPSSSDQHSSSHADPSQSAGHTRHPQSLRSTRSSNNNSRKQQSSFPSAPHTSTGSSTSTGMSSHPAGQGSGFSLGPRTWVQQAADVTDSLLDASKYKSLAVYAEVRLAEALDKAAQACPNSIAGAAPEDCNEGQPLPNPLATAVCCQLLGELADMCGPFQPTLRKLQEALLPSIYSCCSGPSMAGPRPLQFDMLPWFALAGKLRRQNNQLLEQQAAFSLELAQHQEHMGLVEQQMKGLQAALEAGAASSAALEATNATLIAERTAAVSEAAASAEDVKKLTSEVTRLMAELDSVQDQLSAVKEEYSNEQEQWKAQLGVYLQKLHVEAHERTAAVEVAAKEQQELEQKLWEVERKLEEVEQQLQQQSSNPKDAQDQQQLTPRPTDWGQAQQLADACKNTAETVRQLQQQHAAETAALQRQIQLLAALAQPDPVPQPWVLNLRAEASKYFLTELETEPSGAAGFSGVPPKPKLFAAGLGLGPEAPKFLRWDQPVEVHDVALHDLEQQVSGLWQAKAAHEAVHGPVGLQSFIHQHFWQQAASSNSGPLEQGASAAVEPESGAPAAAMGSSDSASVSEQPVLDAAADSSCPAPVADGLVEPVAARAPSNSGDSGSNGSSSAGSGEAAAAAAAAAAADGSSTEQGLAATAAAAAASGYQLYYSCCTHRQDSAAVELMWCVLTGQLPEGVLQEQQQQLQALASLVKAVHEQAGSAGSAGAEAAAAAAAGTSAAAAAGTEAAGPAEAETEAAAPAVEVGSECQQSEIGAGTSSSSADGGSGVAWRVVAAALQAVFPGRSLQQQQELAGWLAAACGMPGNTTTGDSSSSSRFDTLVSAAVLAAVADALQQELRQRFGTTAAAAASEGGWSSTAAAQGAPIDAAAAAGAAAAAASAAGVAAGAVRQLAEGLLRQHLQLLLQHRQQVMQHIQQLLQAAGEAAVCTTDAAEEGGVSGTPGMHTDRHSSWLSLSHPVWQEVARYLQSQQDDATSSSQEGGGYCHNLSGVLAAAAAAAAERIAAGATQAPAAAAAVSVLQRSHLLAPPACRADMQAVDLLNKQAASYN